MQCPNCQSKNMKAIQLDGDLEAIQCEDCAGTWIPSRNYFKYMETNKTDLSALSEYDFEKIFSPKDSTTTKVCPECGKPIVARKAGFGADFFVERCDKCYGIWLDENEWELLKQKNLHSAIYYMFSSSWQAKVRDQAEFDQKLQAVEKLFEKDQAQKIKDFVEWLEDQDNRDEIQSYLLS